MKVRIEDVTPKLLTENCNDGELTCVVNKYGELTLSEGGLIVDSEIYYRGYLKDENKCHDSPVFAVTTTTFSFIEGFSGQDYCTWYLNPADKCADFGRRAKTAWRTRPAPTPSSSPGRARRHQARA